MYYHDSLNLFFTESSMEYHCLKEILHDEMHKISSYVLKIHDSLGMYLWGFLGASSTPSGSELYLPDYIMK